MTGTSPRASVTDTRVWQLAFLPSFLHGAQDPVRGVVAVQIDLMHRVAIRAGAQDVGLRHAALNEDDELHRRFRDVLS